MLGLCSQLFTHRSRRFGVPTALLALCAFAGADEILRTLGGGLHVYKAAATPIQGVKPLPEQRGVNLDGSLRMPSTLPIAISGNPFGANWSPSGALGDVRLDTGTWQPTEEDIKLPAPGFAWVIGRSYNARQSSPTSPQTSDGYQGKNWFQMSQPEIVLYEDPGNGALDVLYFVYGADRYAEYQRTSSTDKTFAGTNGAAGIFCLDDSTSPTTWTLTDQVGNQLTFLGFDSAAGAAKGQIWKMRDPMGNVGYVGSVALANVVGDGFDAEGRIKVAYDPAGRRFTYNYTQSKVADVYRLQSVVAETSDGGAWSGTPINPREVVRVEYDYYPDSPSYAEGEPGDLRTVRLTTPLSDGVTVKEIKTKHYRYYEGAYNSTSNPGNPHQIKLVLGYEGARAYAEAVGDYLSNGISCDALRPYAEAQFEYDAGRRISLVSLGANGACGLRYSDAANAATAFGANNQAYDAQPVRRTTVSMPSYQYSPGSSAVTAWTTQYFDETGQCLSRVLHDGDPANSTAPNSWVDYVVRNSGGVVTLHGTPASVSGYTHGTSVAAASISTNSTSGLVVEYVAVGSGDLGGFLDHSRFRTGHAGTPVTVLRSVAYTSLDKQIGGVNGPSVTRPLVSQYKNYADYATTTNSASALNISYDSYGAPVELSPAVVTSTLPAVNASKNGSGLSAQTKRHLQKHGGVDYEMDAHGSLVYREWIGGLLSKEIRDADTTLNGGPGDDFFGVVVPSGFQSSGAGAPLHEKKLFKYDDQTRRTETTCYAHDVPNARRSLTYYTKLADSRLLTLDFPRIVSGSGTTTYYGPVKFSLRNLEGNVEAEGSIALPGDSVSLNGLVSFIDEAQSDLVAAVDVGSIASLATYQYDQTGTRLMSRRTYVAIPTVSLPGSSGVNYDETAYGYDGVGRRVRESTPHAMSSAHRTIVRLQFGPRGHRLAEWIGANDNGFVGGETTGTSDMVKVRESSFDVNGYLTEVKDFVQDSSVGQRVTSYTNDVRGRPVIMARPAPPHLLRSYDNRGRNLAIAELSSVSGVAVSDDPLMASLPNRRAAARVEYDELGRPFRSVRYKVDPADGSLDDTLSSDYWYDVGGRLTKVDGERLAKFSYDRLGRRTHEYELASDNDSAYADMDDVAGDIVLEERQSAYDKRGLPFLQLGISRVYIADGPSQPTGALDSNADGDLNVLTASNIATMSVGGQAQPIGRVQIRANWFDALDRLTHNADYGTNHASANVATFDRNALAIPASSDSVHVTSRSYNTDGTLKEVVDPRGLKTKWQYDALGRMVARIGNYTGTGAPSSPFETTDQNKWVRFDYEDGLLVTRWVDFDGDGVVDTSDPKDQVTEYAYGVTKGGGVGESRLSSGRLLRQETYPDSDSSTDVVLHAYDAQGARIYTRDPSGTEFVFNYDSRGRRTAERVVSLGGGLDGDVRRVQVSYDSLGRVDAVTQYDTHAEDAGGQPTGTATDEVRYLYDDWGSIKTFRQDPDSSIGSSGFWDVGYSYEKATSGRNTLRRTSQTLPDGNSYSYLYGGANSNAALTSRVSAICDSANTNLVSYLYNGVGAVVETAYNEPNVFSRSFAADTVNFVDRDRFDRPIASRWSRKSSSAPVEFYRVNLQYDLGGNITSQDDLVLTGDSSGSGAHDALYTYDGLDRLLIAQEGTLSGSPLTISVPSRREEFTLGKTGNWARLKRDLNGDSDLLDTGELDEARAHNKVNEILTRDVDNDSVVDFTFAHDAVGNMSSDGESYTYVYDAFGRLRRVLKAGTSDLVSEYRYNGLGQMISRHQDEVADRFVNSSDPKYFLVYDAESRHVATYRGSDSTPKEQFIYHAAGLGGYGRGSYIDAVAFRDWDESVRWTAAADGLDRRAYYCQDWHNNVSALVDADGSIIEYVKYSSYGVPFGIPGGDLNSNGRCTVAECNSMPVSPYDVRADVDLDGDVDSDDKTKMDADFKGLQMGRGVLSSVNSRKGYAGYDFDPFIQKYHVRRRVLDPNLGRWLRRDPLGYVDGDSLLEYCRSNPLRYVDPMGMQADGGDGTWWDYVPPWRTVVQRLEELVDFGGDILLYPVELLIGENLGEAYSSVFTAWSRPPTGGWVPFPLTLRQHMTDIRKYFPIDPPWATLNGMHPWHAANNTYLARRFGLIGTPFILLIGLLHETPVDWGSYWKEEEQGTINHQLDTVGDIASNVLGAAIGLVWHDPEADKFSAWLGSYIPGPGETDETVGGTLTYEGNPVAAWGGYPELMWPWEVEWRGAWKRPTDFVGKEQWDAEVR